MIAWLTINIPLKTCLVESFEGIFKIYLMKSELLHLCSLLGHTNYNFILQCTSDSFEYRLNTERTLPISFFWVVQQLSLINELVPQRFSFILLFAPPAFIEVLFPACWVCLKYKTLQEAAQQKILCG